LFVDELEVVDVEVESESRFKASEAPLIYLRPPSVLSPSGNPACNAPACNFVSAGPEPANPTNNVANVCSQIQPLAMHVLQGSPAQSHQCEPTQPHMANKSLIGVSSAFSKLSKLLPRHPSFEDACLAAQ